jgi:rhodanese-related sulfurtransferase
MEFEYVGHPVGAIHVPLMEPPSWQADPAFVDKVRSLLRERGAANLEATPIMSLCRSGKRSRTAAELLAGSGFTHLYNIAEGFEGDKDASQHRSTVNGWRFRGLPWEQS